MKIKPHLKGGVPIGFEAHFSEKEVHALAHLLSFAHNSHDEGLPAKLFAGLAAACEGVDNDADAAFRSDEPSLNKVYHATRKIFDPEYGGA